MLKPDKLSLFGTAIGLVSLGSGWLSLRPNRLASGTSLNLFQSFGDGAVLIIILWLTCLALSLLKATRRRSIALGLLANVIFATTFWFAGSAAGMLLADQSPLARLSLGGGVWLTLVAVFVLIFAARRRLSGDLLWQNLISWPGLAVFVILFGLGNMNNLSLWQEYHAQQGRFFMELGRHVMLFSLSLFLGIGIGIPLGIRAARSRRAERPIFILANIAETVPSLALFGLLIAPLSALARAFPALQQAGIRGIGAAPAIIALVIYALLPIIQNTFSGLKQIDRGVIEAARGMGMNRRRVFRLVEMPLAMPLVMEGIRTAGVQAVGNTAVAALIGAGGLGQLIFQGLGQAAPDLILLGALPIIILALVVDNLFKVLVELTVPKGIMVAAK